MTYLRTSEEIQKFCINNNIEKISIFSISNHLEINQGFAFLGYFYSMIDDSFYTFTVRGENPKQENKFLATTNVLEFLLISGVFSDASGEMVEEINLSGISRRKVKLFGKIESGHIIEIVALNTGTYMETHFADRTQTISEDLWF